MFTIGESMGMVSKLIGKLIMPIIIIMVLDGTGVLGWIWKQVKPYINH